MELEKTKKTFNWNIISCVFIYAWSGLFFVASLGIEDPASSLFPRIMCGISAVLATLFLISCLRGTDVKEGDEPVSFAGAGRAAIMGVILGGYILANYLTGFYIASIIFLPAGMLYLGQRNWKVIVCVTVALPLIIFLFFDLLLGMMMPTGILFQ